MRVKAEQRLVRVVWVLVALLGAVMPAWASGPRWVGGAPYFYPWGAPIAWYTTNLTYYTDAGDLSASVPHAAADALVARAAAVWNVPTSAMVLSQGGSLAEHVTGAMVTAAGGGVQMPTDVQPSAGPQKPIAVIYDTDGSVIDALLGAGGSDPAGCLQTGVVESVDAFGTDSTIRHAVLILNGRCTGPAPEQQMQMQYQLMRAFGRVLGLGWSQVNDNVFTQSTPPTHDQWEHWPVMHPIDVMCGPYTYQCMPDPFVLRPDDLSSLAQLYFIWQGQGAGMPGKEDSLQRGSTLEGWMYFPNGQGMENMVVAVQRHAAYTAGPEPWQEASTVTGHIFRRANGNPVQALDGSPMNSIGFPWLDREGYWEIERIPIDDGVSWQTMVVTTEPINPLYTGPYALQEQAASSATMAPSGSPIRYETDIANRYYLMRYGLTVNDAAGSCNPGADGTEASPVPMGASGWWTGQLCGYGHSSWTTVAVKLNRTATVEVTALDETGAATAVKAMPMIGLWQASDALGQAPTVGATPVAFNTGVVGMSALQVTGTGSGALRMVITDQRGAGRPDFAYQARVLYGDSISPANVSATGGTVVISGTGFRAGMQVYVNGVAASVTGVTATSITAVVPTLRQLGATGGLLANVVVRDATTGGSSTMMSALGYAAPGQRLQLVSAPGGSVAQGSVANVPLKVLVLGADGVTPQAGQAVTFAVSRGLAVLGACGGVSCTVTTDATGVAATTVQPSAMGTLVLKASTASLSVSATATVIAPDVISLVSAPASVATVGAATGVGFAVRVLSSDGVTPRAGQSLVLTSVGGAARLESCGLPTCNLLTDVNGMVTTAVTPLVAGQIRLQASGAAGVVTTAFTAAAETMTLVSAPVAPVLLGSAAGQSFSVKVVAGDGSTPVAGEAVVFTALGGGVVYGACGGATCTVQTDAHGLASTTVTAQVGGAVVLQAAATSGAVTARFVAGVRTIRVVTSPSGTLPVGGVAGVPFAVLVLAEDGVTPVAGEAVQFNASLGTALLGACGGPTCTVTTNSAGTAQTTVTPESAGAITVAAQAAEGTVSAAMVGQVLPDMLLATAQPAATIYVGDVQSPGLAVQLLLANGVTPVAGQLVTFAVSGGNGVLGCGATSCSVATDAQGRAATTLVAGAAGALVVSITAAQVTQAPPVVWTGAVLARVRAVSLPTPVMYVAEGRTVNETAAVVLSDNSAVTNGVAVAWTGAAGLVFAAPTSVASGQTATVPVQVAGLPAGGRVAGTVCAWTSVCTAVEAQGVSATEWRVAITGTTAQAVTALVTDAAGHPVAGVPVNVQEVVTAWQQACAGGGRCPNPPVLRTATAMATSDAAGQVSFAPMPLQSGEVLQTSLAAGTSGMAQTALVRLP